MEEDQVVQEPNSPLRHDAGSERSNIEAVRSRWSPKPEQILILESIFNSGMVNPAKDETVRIRKLLEKFGCVGDANVFYWFQNRRSRSRRRQRQIQATLSLSTSTGEAAHDHPWIHYESSSTPGGFAPSPNSFAPSSCLLGSSSSSGSVLVDHDLFSFSGQMGLPEIDQQSTAGTTSMLCSPSVDTSNIMHYQSGLITVFINGVPTEVPRGPLDTKAMFGQEIVLVHSSGVPLPFNEYGFTIQSLQHGESYFLVSRPT